MTSLEKVPRQDNPEHANLVTNGSPLEPLSPKTDLDGSAICPPSAAYLSTAHDVHRWLWLISEFLPNTSWYVYYPGRSECSRAPSTRNYLSSLIKSPWSGFEEAIKALLRCSVPLDRGSSIDINEKPIPIYKFILYANSSPND